jgi:hypothetical protein
MKARLPYFLGVTATCVSASCFGGFDNRPLEPGSGGSGLRGSIAGPIDVDRAYVAVVGRSDLVAALDARGVFSFSATLAPGMYEIAASTGLGRATRRPVTLYPTRTLDLAIDPELGGTIHGRVELDVTSTTAATVRIEGLPVETRAAIDTGVFELTSVPPGQIRLIVSEPGFETTLVDLDLASGTSTNAHPHLAAHGEGVCGACTDDHSCASRVCGSFETMLYGITEHSCVTLCGHDGSCDPGFRCAHDLSMPSRSICVPADTTCAAFASLYAHAECTLDTMCGRGIGDGICRGSRCTVSCFDGQAACPFGTTCIVDHQDLHGRCQ